MNEELAQTIDENIENLPPEVSDFIFGEGLESVLNEIVALVQNNEATLRLKNDVTFFLLGITPIEDVITYIDTLSIPDDKKLVIKKLVKEKIIDELLLLIEVHEEMDKTTQVSNTSTETGSKTSPSPALISLQSRLTQSNMIMPVKRDLSPDSTPSAAPSVPTKPLIDPYRELPEK